MFKIINKIDIVNTDKFSHLPSMQELEATLGSYSKDVHD